MAENTTSDVLSLTAKIVAAHVASNQLNADALPSLIQSVFQSLSTVNAATAEPLRPLPAVPWKKSVFPDFIICLEDGKKMKILKGHLRASYNLTTEQYREKWGLPHDYPMVAPNYSSRRSAMARQIGLGLGASRGSRKPVKPATARGTKATES